MLSWHVINGMMDDRDISRVIEEVPGIWVGNKLLAGTYIKDYKGHITLSEEDLKVNRLLVLPRAKYAIIWDEQ